MQKLAFMASLFVFATSAVCILGADDGEKLAEPSCAQYGSFCTREMAPVCGSDGITYNSACKFCAVIRKITTPEGRNRKILHNGPCASETDEDAKPATQDKPPTKPEPVKPVNAPLLSRFDQRRKPKPAAKEEESGGDDDEKA